MFENWARLVVYLSKSDKLSSYCFRTEIVYIRYEFVRQHSGRMVGFTCDKRIHAYIMMDSMLLLTCTDAHVNRYDIFFELDNVVAYQLQPHS